MPHPRISVIMPVYNGAAYLAEAIDSILAQSFADFEFLIHDDGSTDNAPQILRDRAARDSRIVLSSGPNAGVAAALNTMIARAQGDYIARMDGDDISLPDRFAKQVAWLDAHPDIDVLGTGCLVIDGAGRRLFTNMPPQTHAEIDALNLRGLCQFEHPTVMMRTAALRAAGGYDTSRHSAEDIDLWLRLAETGRLANLPEITLRYRVHEGSVSGARRDEQMENCRKAVEAAKARRGVEAPFDYRHWRMEDTKDSRREHYTRTAWQAWAEGFTEGWRHYAWEVAKLDPLSPAAWKPLILGALRRP